jgi:hypothetical protein
MTSSSSIQDMDMCEDEPNPFVSSDELAENETTRVFEATDRKMWNDTRLDDEDISESSPLLAGHGRVERSYEFNLVACLWSVARCLLCCSSESADFR